ncbi:methylated-DNA--[protein]-cysteine S-methyltransferase [Parasalinivibrio latis]|uniref:methylated-DNA--[protein]-cysteine S-methyltransferase n=1 Tax=Parasalinivibrio latis TaxID=2952610 RepID=UPI0030E207E0
MYYHFYHSPLGKIRITASDNGITSLMLPVQQKVVPLCEEAIDIDEPFTLIVSQLDEYFAGKRDSFNVRLDVKGTPFQRRVWDALCDIPYGNTRTYGELATMIGKPTGSRAVGAANGQNPVAIIVPCHRVIGADGSLTGYAGGLDAKKALLALEREFC